MTKFFYPDLSHKILGACFKVQNSLGCGLPEICYQKALIFEFLDNNIIVEEEKHHKVYYNNKQVGYFKTDIIACNKIILELKSTDILNKRHEGQLLSYLKISKLKIGYLINFGNLLLEHIRLIL